MTRQVIGGAVIAGIVSGILIDTWMTHNPSTIAYAREAEKPQEVLIEAKINWTKERIAQEIEKKAMEYGVSARTMKAVIHCESQGSTTIQSFHRYRFTDPKRGIYEGERELSFGLSQIHLPDHPTVTKEEAMDPEFAINFMAEKFSQGKQELWSCY